MTGPELIARLEGLGAHYEAMHGTFEGEPCVTRYFTYRGRTSVVDLGDLNYVTPTVLRRVCADLGIDFEDVTALAH